MSAVHDWATLTQDWPDGDLTVGDRIEIVGYVWQGFQLLAVYRDERGYVWTLPTMVLRLEPHVSEVPA